MAREVQTIVQILWWRLVRTIEEAQYGLKMLEKLSW